MRKYSVHFCIDVFRPQNSIYFFVGKIFVVLFIKCVNIIIESNQILYLYAAESIVISFLNSCQCTLIE